MLDTLGKPGWLQRVIFSQTTGEGWRLARWLWPPHRGRTAGLGGRPVPPVGRRDSLRMTLGAQLMGALRCEHDR